MEEQIRLLDMKSCEDGIKTTYQLKITNGIECWAVTLRYSEFRRSHVQLQESFKAADLPPFPPKEPIFQRLLGNVEEQALFQIHREHELRQYLVGLLQQPDLCRSLAVQKLLDAPSHVAPRGGDSSGSTATFPVDEEQGVASFSGFRVRLTGELGGLEVIIRSGSHMDESLRPRSVRLSLQELTDESGSLAASRRDEVLEFGVSTEVKKRFSLPPGTFWEVAACGVTAKGFVGSAVSLRVRAPGEKDLDKLPPSAIASFGGSFASTSPSRAEEREARAPLKCIGCSGKMVWCIGHFSEGEGRYVGGQFVCNNGNKCVNPSGPLQQGFRWNCRHCLNDFCSACEPLEAARTTKVQSEDSIVEDYVANAEAERLEAEKTAKADAERLEAERAKAQAEQVEAEKAATAEAKRVEAERAAKAEAERLEAERNVKAEADRLEAERAAKAEAERLEAEKAEAERVEAERAAKAEAERLEAERNAKAEAERQEAERAAKAEAERLEAEKAATAEAERVEAERAAKAEAERLEAEKTAREKAERLEAERAANKEAERLQRAAKAEADQLEAERAAKAEAARLQNEATVTDNPQSAVEIVEPADVEVLEKESKSFRTEHVSFGENQQESIPSYTSSQSDDGVDVPQSGEEWSRGARFASDDFTSDDVNDTGSSKVPKRNFNVTRLPLGPEDHRVLSARGNVASAYLKNVEEKSLQGIEKAPYRFEARDGEKRTVPLRFSARSAGNLEEALQERKDAEVLDQTRHKMVKSKVQKEEESAAQWIAAVTDHPDVYLATQGETTLQAALQSGEALCDLINAVWPERITGILRGEVKPMRRVDNMQKFCKACKEAGVDDASIPAPLDVAMGREGANVLPCLFALSAVFPSSSEAPRLPDYMPFATPRRCTEDFR